MKLGDWQPFIALQSYAWDHRLMPDDWYYAIFIILSGMVGSAGISFPVSVKKRGQGQSRAGNAGGSIGGGGGGGGGGRGGIGGHGIGEGGYGSIGGGAQGQGDGDDDNDGGRIVGNGENGRRRRNPTREEIATIYLVIILQSIGIIQSLNDADLSTTGRTIRSFSTIINLVGFICCTAVLWQPCANPSVARMLNPRMIGILSRTGPAFAVLGFISTMLIDLPLFSSCIVGLAFLVLLALFLVDMSEARQ